MATRFHFSLGSLLIAITCFCIGMGCVMLFLDTLDWSAHALLPFLALSFAGVSFGCAAGALLGRRFIGAYVGWLLAVTLVPCGILIYIVCEFGKPGW